MLISPAYRDLNRELHERGIGYGTNGHRWAPLVIEIAKDHRCMTVLDYGSGDSSLRRALADAPLLVRDYDPAIGEKAATPAPADLVVCADVLEHVEPDCIDAVLDDLRRLAERAVFLVVSTIPAKKVLADGRNAHILIRPPSWWLDLLLRRWELWRFERQPNGFLVLMAPR